MITGYLYLNKIEMYDRIDTHSVLSGVHAQGAAPENLFTECGDFKMLNASNLLSNGFGLNAKSIWFSTELSFHEKVVLQYLMCYMGAGKNVCWPSLSTITKHLSKNEHGPGMGKASVVKAIRGLCHKGAITKSLEDRSNGSKSNSYKCLILPDGSGENDGGSGENDGGSVENRGGSVENSNINMNTNNNINSNKEKKKRTITKSPSYKREGFKTIGEYTNVYLNDEQIKGMLAWIKKRFPVGDSFQGYRLTVTLFSRMLEQLHLFYEKEPRRMEHDNHSLTLKRWNWSSLQKPSANDKGFYDDIKEFV
jgi:hypothetical protein